MVAAPLSRTVFRVPQLTRVGLLGLWDEEAAFDGFLAAHPIAARFASDWQARLAPVRATGSRPGRPGQLSNIGSAEDGSAASSGPAVVLTLGLLRLGQAGRFLRASASARAEAAAEPDTICSGRGDFAVNAGFACQYFAVNSRATWKDRVHDGHARPARSAPISVTVGPGPAGVRNH